MLQQPGRLTIPGIELPWWNPVAERLQTENVPALDLEVAVNPDLLPRVDPVERLSGLAADRPWALGSGLLGIAAICWAAARWLPGAIRRLGRWRAARRRSEPARFKRLLRACRSHDPVRIYNAYLNWLSGDDGPGPALAGAEDLAGELERLQGALIGRDPDWRAGRLERALRGARQALRRRHEQALQDLPPLNP